MVFSDLYEIEGRDHSYISIINVPLVFSYDDYPVKDVHPSHLTNISTTYERINGLPANHEHKLSLSLVNSRTFIHTVLNLQGDNIVSPSYRTSTGLSSVFFHVLTCYNQVF